MSQITRRGYLRSTSAFLALPFLESLGFRRFASAKDQTPAPANRLIFMGTGYGVTEETWYPDRDTQGAEYELPDGLSPLVRHKDDITVVQNLQHRYSNEGHWGSTFWLTGANRYDIPGQSFHNTISVDQVAAERLGQQTRFTSMQLDSASAADGHGPGLSLAWNRQGKPVPAVRTPVDYFHKLFSASDMSLEERQANLKDERSVLDTVLEDAKWLNRNLTKTDKEKLDEYFGSIREIEVRLSKEDEWLGVPKRQPDPKRKVPGESLKGISAVEVMYDLMVAAMQVDASRVFSYRLPGDSFIAEMGAEISAHSVSHYSEGERRNVSEARDRKHSELLASFIDKLKATNEADGSRLYDHIALAFGSNISRTHSLRNCPTLLSGGGAGFAHGRHLVMDNPKTPICNLWLSTLQGIGFEDVESFGDSNGRLNELFG